ncbi:hypothetical protein THIOKS12570005 [Thiocapsa sp. KS1]|nr:hypothetical protein THIOKS12570005 [Thiocapsa sp. KS1]
MRLHSLALSRLPFRSSQFDGPNNPVYRGGSGVSSAIRRTSFDPAQATLGLRFRVNYQKHYGLLELRHRLRPVP